MIQNVFNFIRGKEVNQSLLSDVNPQMAFEVSNFTSLIRETYPNGRQSFIFENSPQSENWKSQGTPDFLKYSKDNEFSKIVRP
jgi:hypothetical protein